MQFMLCHLFCGLRRSVFVVGSPSLRCLHDRQMLELTTMVFGVHMYVSGCIFQSGERKWEPLLKIPLVMKVHDMSRSPLWSFPHIVRVSTLSFRNRRNHQELRSTIGFCFGSLLPVKKEANYYNIYSLLNSITCIGTLYEDLLTMVESPR